MKSMKKAAREQILDRACWLVATSTLDSYKEFASESDKAEFKGMATLATSLGLLSSCEIAEIEDEAREIVQSGMYHG